MAALGSEYGECPDCGIRCNGGCAELDTAELIHEVKSEERSDPCCGREYKDLDAGTNAWFITVEANGEYLMKCTESFQQYRIPPQRFEERYARAG